MVNPETEIQNTILEYLTINGYFCWRQNNGAVYSKKYDRFLRPAKYSIRGVPDIVFFASGGRVVFLEVKQPKRYQSKEQKEFEEYCKKFDVEYYVVHSLEDIKNIL